MSYGTPRDMDTLLRTIGRERAYDEPSLPPPSTAVRTPPRKEDRSCRCSEVDGYGRHCIGLCGPDCEGRPQ